MAEQAARRGHQHDLAAITLRQHLPPNRARDQPALRDICVHHVEEALWRHVDDLGDVVLTRGDDEDVHPAETFDRLGDNNVAGRFARRAPGDLLHVRAALAALGGDLGELFRLAGRQHELRAGGGQCFRGDGAECAGSAGDDRDLSFDRKEGERVGGSFGHGFTPGG